MKNSCIKPVFLFLPLLFGTGGFAEENSGLFKKTAVEIKAGYFFFSDSQMRKIYDKGGLDVQLSTSYSLLNYNKRWVLDLYGAVEYFERSGKSLNSHQKTSLWSIPVNMGIRPLYVINDNVQWYLGFGPRYFYIHQHNHSSYVNKNGSRNGLGFFLNTGFNYMVSKSFVIDAFGEYSYGKTRFHLKKSGVYTKTTQIGGFTFGLGFGYKF